MAGCRSQLLSGVVCCFVVVRNLPLLVVVAVGVVVVCDSLFAVRCLLSLVVLVGSCYLL